MCAGNQCCRDGSTCPSAEGSFHSCPHPKKQDCTKPPSPSPPTPTPSPSPPPSPPQCTLKTNTDVAVRHYKRTAAKTAGECCDACTADPLCKAAVFYGHGGCNLKDQVR